MALANQAAYNLFFHDFHHLSSKILIWICITAAFLTEIQGSDFNKEDPVNPCDLTSLAEPSGFCYCTPDDVHVAIDVKCGFQTNPSEREWRAISTFEAATTIQFVSRPAGAIQQIPPYYVFEGMKNLHYFTMKIATVGTIPSFAFGNSSFLAEIDLQDNNIYELMPYAFANLHNLTGINLSENNLTEINRNVFVNLPKLKELVLMKNGILTIHDYAFKDLQNLADLALQNNRLTVITREVFSGLQRMKNLDLQGNHIDYIGDHVFAEMPGLRDLDLNGNKIISVSPKGFAGLRLLERLNLKDNKIVRLQSTTFSYFSKIHFLDLRSNELETLNHALMKPIYKNLKDMNMQLLIEGNRFLCDCRILWMKSLYNETQSDYVKHHISSTTCDLFENTNKHETAISSSSPTYFRTDGSNSGVTILTSPPEETTTYAFESVKNILNLTAKDVKCSEEDLMGKTSELPFAYHHQQMVPKGTVETSSGHPNRNVFLGLNRDNNQQNSHAKEVSVGKPNDEFHHYHQNLNEPQATAALEGTDFIEAVPETSIAGQKVDSSRVSSAQPSSASTLQIRNCDLFVLMVSLIGLLVAMGLK